MNPERVFRILWGPSLENALDFAFPVVGEAPTFSRRPRAGSTMVSTGASAVASITGRYFRLKVNAKYFGGQQNFGATGLQAFIDWAADSNAFTLMPNIALPTLTVTGCYLEGPFTQLNPSQEQDSTQTLPLTILHPTVDLGVAWRGLFFEYVAGQSLADPTRAVYSRSSVGYEITPQGYLLAHPADGVCDGNYIDRVSGLQTTLIENAVANDITNPEDLSNASWDKTTNVTVTPNNAKAPDQVITADLVVETVTNGVHCIASNATVIASGDVQTAIVFLRDGGRYRGAIYFGNGIGASPANRFGVTYDLSLGTISPNNLGAGTLAASRIVALAGGWFMIWMRGAINGGELSSNFNLRMFDNAGTGSYAGDAASGTYYWGATAVHGAFKCLASYTPTTASNDRLSYAYTVPAQAGWWYTKFVEWDAALAGGNFPRLLELASAEFVTPGWVINPATPNYSVTLQLAGGSQSVSRPAGSPGDIVELLFIIYADASIELRQSINGAAETTSGRSATIPGGLPATWSAPTKLGIGDTPSTNGGRASSTLMNAVRHGPLVLTGPAAVTTIAQARYA